MPTFNEVSSLQLRSLCNALELRRFYPEYLLLQRFLFESWGERQVPLRPAYRSLIADDHSPYEYSVAFGPDGVELRILLEAQGTHPNRISNYAAALELTNKLADVFSLDVSRLDEVTDLLCPSEAPGPFSMWHAVSLRPDRPPSFKVYLNPNAQGHARAHEVVAEALERTGVRQALPVLSQVLTRRGSGLDELNYFSLDLSDAEDARVKIYFCHHGATAAELERIFELAPSNEAGDVTAFCLDMIGHRGPFVRKPVTSCFAFIEGRDTPATATLHVPVAHYASSDREVSDRMDRVLRRTGSAADAYAELIDKFPALSHASGTGLQSYTSFRRERGALRLTVYLCPGLFYADGSDVSEHGPISELLPLRSELRTGRARS